MSLKRFLHFLLVFTLITFTMPAISTYASDIVESGVCGEKISWTLDSDGTLTFIGSGDMYDYYVRFTGGESGAAILSSNIPWNTYDFAGSVQDISIQRITKIKRVIIPEGITSIGDNVLSGCCNLKNISIPSSIERIGRNAFDKCSELDDIYIEDLSSWCKIDFADDISLNDYNLYLKGDLITKLVIPDDVTEIKKYTFTQCKSITDVIIHSGVTDIDTGSFLECRNLKNISIPSSIERIGRNAFDKCSELDDIYIEDLSSWCKIDFADDISLNDYNLYLKGDLITKLVIPDDVTEIKKYTFTQCKSITDVIIHSGVTDIDVGSFLECGNLESFQVNEDNPAYSSDDGILFNKQKTELIRFPNVKAGDYEIPHSVTDIAKDAFSYCTNIMDIIIHPGITTLYMNSFYGCRSLKSITIPSGLTNDDVFSDAFYSSNYNLTDIYFGGTKEEWLRINKNVHPVPSDRINIYTKPFDYTDVPSGEWYEESVAFVAERKLMKGIGDKKFNPLGNLTVAEAITMAARIHRSNTLEREIAGLMEKIDQIELEIDEARKKTSDIFF